MRLSWNEIRARAADFADKWAGQGYERGQTQLFYRDFLDVYGIPVRRVASFEEPVRLLGDRRGYIDLLWKGVLLVEQKSAGLSLERARTQALEYFPGLKDFELPRYVLVSDFQYFELYDLDEHWSTNFDLRNLPKHVEKFAFLLGIEKRVFRDQDPANIQASKLMAQLHDELKAVGYGGHDLERFLVRLVFCLFADDTGIFERRGQFEDLVSDPRRSAADLGQCLHQLFEVLDTPEDRRQTTLDEDLAAFPYIDGELFRERLTTPAFNAAMRGRLLQACAFNWEKISPAIFGSLFQAVMDKDERRAEGAHYTTEKNILKVVEPLVFDDLRAEFERLKRRADTRRTSELRAFQERLGRLRFFDPACGCGNFLVIAYRELRRLEIEVLKEIHRDGRDREGYYAAQLDVSQLSVVDVDQFHGIELAEFPARIAETALWMMDHIMNVELSAAFGAYYARIPLKKSPRVVCGDALETDWNTVLPAAECSFVLGNPPFAGAKYQSERQRAQVRRVAELGGSGGTLDYVAAWFVQAAQYIQGARARIGFVATNSISQGEQVAQLWPILLDRYGLEIVFAHRTFAWGSEAPGVAHVHVVIVGLANRGDAPAERRLFSYKATEDEPHESRYAAITPYLFGANELTDPHLVVRETARPLNGFPPMLSGSQPIDGGLYIFDDEERRALLESEPGAERFLRPYVGSRDFINGLSRWILALQDAKPAELRPLPRVRERMDAVRRYRAQSRRTSTLAIKDLPQRYNVEVFPDGPFLVIPEVSSERRNYIPIGWLESPAVPSNLVRVVPDVTLPLFALLTSKMHMAWLRHIGGRLKSDFRYSIGLVYNTFPPPPAEPKDLDRLAPLAQAIFDARAKYPESNLALLYDPEYMPAALTLAHRAVDRAVDRLYRRAPFESDRERVEHLFGLYEKLVAPINGLAAPPRRRRRR